MTEQRQRRISPLLVWSLVIIVVGGLVVGYNYMVFRADSLMKSKGMPPFKQVSAFELTSSEGNAVADTDLTGKVWIADFIFTRCLGPCPRLSAQMAKLQEKLGGVDDVRLVTFTVDPEYDTPDIMAEYAARFGADTKRWLFLTGPRKQMWDLIVKGFQLVVAEAPEEARESHGMIVHSTKFVLVDRKGLIRRYYDGESEEAMKQLLEDVEFIRRQ